MIDLARIRSFYEVAKAKSFSKAAQKLELHQSTLSRTVSGLESDMGEKLFRRHKDGVDLTPTGREFLQVVEKIVRDVDSFYRHIHDDALEPEGDLHIQTTTFFGAEWLCPLMKEFLELYPKIRLKIELGVQYLELGTSDAIIRTYVPGSPHLIQIPISRTRYKILGSKDYLSQYGIPLTAQDLDDHKLITFMGERETPLGNSNWLLYAGKKPQSPPRQSTTVVNSFHAMLQLVKVGCGLAALPDLPMLSGSDLVEVLPGIEHPEIENYLIYDKSRQNAKKLACLARYLTEKN
jgi:DNA-binding transcriptional LysR family regulator